MDVEARAMRKIFWHLMPILMFGSAMSYIDRANIGFAALTMNADLGLTAAAFGVASGAFYLTYALFEMPSNSIQGRVGARRWLARIMISWGLLSAATAFAYDFTSLLVLRVLLGAAEAGFTPGVFWFLTFWFPERYRGRAVAIFLAAQVVGVVLGSALAGPLLAMSGWGLKGWQWMFVIQGLPTVIGGLVMLRVLVDKPAAAEWLAEDEKAWLEETIGAERKTAEKDSVAPKWTIVFHPRILYLTLIYFLTLGAGLALAFFQPLILRETGLSLTMTGLATALVYAASGVGVLLWGWWIDRTAHRELVVAAACLLFGIAFAIMPFARGALTLVLLMAFVSIGVRSAVSAFWSIPPKMVHPAALGLVIAFISSVGNLGGVFGPAMFGVLRDRTGSYDWGAWVAALMGIAAALLVLLIPRFRKVEGPA